VAYKTGLGSLRDVRKGRRARRSPEDDYPDEQTGVTNSGHYKSLYRRIAGRRLLEPVSDEQVGAKTHQLPEDVELDEVRRQHEPEHRCREQV
jgi:hypothetical protein